MGKARAPPKKRIHFIRNNLIGKERGALPAVRQLNIAIMLMEIILATVRLKRICCQLAILPAIVLLGAGCTGINASGGVSPLSFFLPGLVQNKPAAPAPEKVLSNSSQSEPVKHLAQSN